MLFDMLVFMLWHQHLTYSVSCEPHKLCSAYPVTDCVILI